ncbi:MAG: hypothetical protein ACT4QG_21780, partial [Sporichthyaceae bacterium]
MTRASAEARFKPRAISVRGFGAFLGVLALSFSVFAAAPSVAAPAAPAAPAPEENLCAPAGGVRAGASATNPAPYDSSTTNV